MCPLAEQVTYRVEEIALINERDTKKLKDAESARAEVTQGCLMLWYILGILMFVKLAGSFLSL